MKIVVTGMADEEMTSIALDFLHEFSPISLLIETGGPQAELWARFWAEDNEVPIETVRDATPVRTAIEVFKRRPAYVLAFPWYDLALINRAKARGVQVGFAEIGARVDPKGTEGADRAPDTEAELPGDR